MVLLRQSFPLLLTLLATADAAPTNSYPLALQYPPLIQQNVPYQYTLPSDTFTSSTSTVIYSVDNLPDWLAFDSNSRTISGTPNPFASPGSIWFDIIGTDDSGTTSVNSSLILTNATVASLSSSLILSEELRTAGSLASSNTIVLKPSQPFHISFPTTSFNGSGIVQYTAVTKEHTPLPIWISFDASSLSFSGTTPASSSDIASQDYSLSLLAIQVPGFSSAALNFDMQISPHLFLTNVTSDNQTAVPGQNLVWNVPLDKMSLDGFPVSVANISALAISPQPDWLTVNKSSASLEGKVPKDFPSSNYTVTVTNEFHDSVEIQLELNLNATENEVFNQSSLPAVNATQNEFFSYQLPVASANANFLVSYNPPASWLTFTKANMTFSGNVPNDFSGTTATLTNLEDQEKLALTIRAIPHETHADPPSPTPSPSPSLLRVQDSGSSKKTVAIVCGTVIPITVLSLLAILFCCYRRRVRNSKDEDEINPGGVGATEKIPRARAPSVNGTLINGSHPYGSTDKFSMYSTPALTTSSTETPIMTTTSGALKKDWDTPAKATEVNLYNLDNPKFSAMEFVSSPMSNAFSEASDRTHVATEPIITHTVTAPTGLGLAVLDQNASNLVPQSAEFSVVPPTIPPRAALRNDEASQLNPPGKARNSWRQQTNAIQERRWHSRNQGGSLASIGTDELISMRMVSGSDNAVTSGEPGIGRENSSPILKPIGDSDSEYSSYANSDRLNNLQERNSRHTANSNSIGSYSSSEESENPYANAVPHLAAAELGAIAESPNLKYSHKAAAMQSSGERGGSASDQYESYRTASSGNDYSHGEYGDDESGDSSDEDVEHLRPVRRNGEWDLEKVPGPRTPVVDEFDSASNTPVMYGQAIDTPIGEMTKEEQAKIANDRIRRRRSTVRVSSPNGIYKVN